MKFKITLLNCEVDLCWIEATLIKIKECLPRRNFQNIMKYGNTNIFWDVFVN